MKDNRYKKLVAFTMSVQALYPNIKTVHSLEEESFREQLYPEDLQVLFELLLHSQTVLQKLYRLKDVKGNYISQREDYAVALEMISPLLSTRGLDVKENVRKYYQTIVDEIGYSRSFTWRDIATLTGKSKTRCNDVLQHLLSYELVKRVGKGYQDIYKYELLPQATLEHQNNLESIWDIVNEVY